MPSALLALDEHLERVTDETNKAAGYLVAARATRFVPRLEERWPDSPTQLAFNYLQQGSHMAFLVTLASILEDTRAEVVNLPKLLRRFNDQEVRRELASQRRLDRRVVYERTQALRRHFTTRLAPNVPRLTEVRNSVVAHHGMRIDWPATTIGLLNRLLFGAVALVDGASELVTGDRTGIRETMRVVRYQAELLWSAGMDGPVEGDTDAPDGLR